MNEFLAILFKQAGIFKRHSQMERVDPQTKEKVKALVREVLAKATSEPSEPPVTERVIVNSLRERAEREFDRDESSKSLITEDDLRGLEPGSRVRVSAKAKFTPLASDIVADKGLELLVRTPRETGIKARTLAIGADHGGFEAKEILKSYLAELGLAVRDFGTNSKEAVDYPDIALAVAKAVSGKQADVGILIDGAGIGSAMAANKVPGVRAAGCYSTVLARNAREHNGANILSLGAGQNSVEEMKAIIEAFLTSELAEPRHMKRVEKIDSIDRSYRI